MVYWESTVTNCNGKRSHKVKVTKKDVYLSDDYLNDHEKNITEPKRKRHQKLKTVS